MATAVVEPRPGTTTAATPARRISRQARLALPYLLSVAIVGVGWELLARRFGLFNLFPTATMTFGRLAELLMDGTLIEAAAFSMVRILAGFLVGSLAGTLLGLVLGSFPLARAANEPFMHFFRFIPPLAWFAPVLLWFGTGEIAKVALIVYTTVFLVALNTMAGVAAVPHNKLRMAGAFGANRRQVFLLVTLPASAPYIFNGMRIAMGNSFATIVVAEMLAAQDGLGYLINSGLLFANTATVFTGIIALGVLGFVTDRLFQWLIRRFGGRFTVGPSVSAQ